MAEPALWGWYRTIWPDRRCVGPWRWTTEDRVRVRLPRSLRGRWREVSDRWVTSGIGLRALRLTQGGHPEHPLYLPASLVPHAIMRTAPGWCWKHPQPTLFEVSHGR